MPGASGREQLARHLPIDGRATWIVRAALSSPGLRRLLSLWRYWLSAGAAVRLAVWLAKRLRRSRAATMASRIADAEGRAAAAGAKPGTAPGRPARPPRLPRARFLDLLRPERGQAAFVGRSEVAVLVAASFANAWLMLYKAWLMREFVTGQNLGLWKQWFSALAKFPFATLAMALLSQTTKFTQARVSLLWRREATSRLLRDYFAGMNYYKLLHHGQLRIDDPDVRICTDVRAACDALTGVFMSGLSGVTMSVFSSVALYRRRGLAAVFLSSAWCLLRGTGDVAADAWARRAPGCERRERAYPPACAHGAPGLSSHKARRQPSSSRTGRRHLDRQVARADEASAQVQTAPAVVSASRAKAVHLQLLCGSVELRPGET